MTETLFIFAWLFVGVVVLVLVHKFGTYGFVTGDPEDCMWALFIVMLWPLVVTVGAALTCSNLLIRLLNKVIPK